MSALRVGYARCSTDLAAQCDDGLLNPGVHTDRIYVDHGLTGTHRERPGVREALAACRSGDTLVVTEPDRREVRRDAGSGDGRLDRATGRT